MKKLGIVVGIVLLCAAAALAYLRLKPSAESSAADKPKPPTPAKRANADPANTPRSPALTYIPLQQPAKPTTGPMEAEYLAALPALAEQLDAPTLDALLSTLEQSFYLDTRFPSKATVEWQCEKLNNGVLAACKMTWKSAQDRIGTNMLRQPADPNALEPINYTFGFSQRTFEVPIATTSGAQEIDVLEGTAALDWPTRVAHFTWPPGTQETRKEDKGAAAILRRRERDLVEVELQDWTSATTYLLLAEDKSGKALKIQSTAGLLVDRSSTTPADASTPRKFKLEYRFQGEIAKLDLYQTLETTHRDVPVRIARVRQDANGKTYLSSKPQDLAQFATLTTALDPETVRKETTLELKKPRAEGEPWAIAIKMPGQPNSYHATVDVARLKVIAQGGQAVDIGKPSQFRSHNDGKYSVSFQVSLADKGALFRKPSATPEPPFEKAEGVLAIHYPVEYTVLEAKQTGIAGDFRVEINGGGVDVYEKESFAGKPMNETIRHPEPFIEAFDSNGTQLPEQAPKGFPSLLNEHIASKAFEGAVASVKLYFPAKYFDYELPVAYKPN